MIEALSGYDRRPKSSTEYRHESACDLFDPQHVVSGDIVAVLEALPDAFDVDVDVGAAGCSGCWVSDAPVSIAYTAQGNGTQHSIYLKYDCDDDFPLSRAGVASVIVGVARTVGVPVEWDGDEDTAVLIGEDAR